MSVNVAYNWCSAQWTLSCTHFATLLGRLQRRQTKSDTHAVEYTTCLAHHTNMPHFTTHQLAIVMAVHMANCGRTSGTACIVAHLDWGTLGEHRATATMRNNYNVPHMTQVPQLGGHHYYPTSTYIWICFGWSAEMTAVESRWVKIFSLTVKQRIFTALWMKDVFIPDLQYGPMVKQPCRRSWPVWTNTTPWSSSLPPSWAKVCMKLTQSSVEVGPKFVQWCYAKFSKVFWKLSGI